MRDTLFPETGRAVVSLLERLDHPLDFPERRTYCGRSTGRRLSRGGLAHARRFADPFADTTPSSALRLLFAMVREYPALCRRSPRRRLGHAVADISPRVYELTESHADKLGVEDMGATFQQRVTYHASCHGLRALQLGDRPLRLLRKVRGIDLAELPSSETCCRFRRNLLHRERHVSAAM